MLSETEFLRTVAAFVDQHDEKHIQCRADRPSSSRCRSADGLHGDRSNNRGRPSKPRSNSLKIPDKFLPPKMRAVRPLTNGEDKIEEKEGSFNEAQNTRPEELHHSGVEENGGEDRDGVPASSVLRKRQKEGSQGRNAAPLKRARRKPLPFLSSISEEVLSLMRATNSQNPRYWSAREQTRFYGSLAKDGYKNAVKISEAVSTVGAGSRNPTQVRTHVQKLMTAVARRVIDYREERSGCARVGNRDVSGAGGAPSSPPKNNEDAALSQVAGRGGHGPDGIHATKAGNNVIPNNTVYKNMVDKGVVPETERLNLFAVVACVLSHGLSTQGDSE